MPVFIFWCRRRDLNGTSSAGHLAPCLAYTQIHSSFLLKSINQNRHAKTCNGELVLSFLSKKSKRIFFFIHCFNYCHTVITTLTIKQYEPSHPIQQPANIKGKTNVFPLMFVVPKAGLEPAHCCQYWILSPARLPISPLRHIFYCFQNNRYINIQVIKLQVFYTNLKSEIYSLQFR